MPNAALRAVQAKMARPAQPAAFRPNPALAAVQAKMGLRQQIPSRTAPTTFRPPVVQRASTGFRPLMSMQELEALVDSPEYADELAHSREPLGAVSLPSAAHWLDKLNEKYDQIVLQPWGFSVALKSLQESDVKEINAYILLWNTAKDVSASPVEHGIGLTINKTEYTVHGRTYSTHEDSNQLYPINGPGIGAGNGPADMYWLLKAKGWLDNAKIIRLYELSEGTRSATYQSKAEEKKSGGHHSKVEMPKIPTTSAANIGKMNQLKLVPLLKKAKEALEAIPKSRQYSNQL